MLKHKFNVRIHKTIAAIASVTCVLMLFSHLSSVNIKANSIFDFYAFGHHCDHPCLDENNKSENETNPCCSVPCYSNTCCIIMELHGISVSINPNGLTKADFALDEPFNKEDILSSIFKPPKF